MYSWDMSSWDYYQAVPCSIIKMINNYVHIATLQQICAHCHVFKTIDENIFEYLDFFTTQVIDID